jgi:hypothetical protein
MDQSLRPTSQKSNPEHFTHDLDKRNAFTTDKLLVKKILKWNWKLRPLDMITIDLSLIPTVSSQIS